MERLNMSLDDMITSNRSGGRGNGSHPGGGRGGKARGGQGQRQERQEQPYRAVMQAEVSVKRKPVSFIRPTPEDIERTTAPSKPTAPSSRPSILSRVGSGVSGTGVTFSSLNNDIRASDIVELCGTVGETKRVEMLYDAQGKPIGSAEVVFVRRSEALDCVKKFNNLTLDGRPMVVKLSGAEGRENPFNPTPVEPATGEAFALRGGLFGSAIREQTQDSHRRATHSSDNNTGPAFKVTFGDGHVKPRQAMARGNERAHPGRGHQGRGHHKGAPSSSGPRAARVTPSAGDLDNDLDSYMAAR